jgi:hypothetical protein
LPISSYATGTVAVANGATAIVGTGTLWTGVNARAGDDIIVAGHTVIVEDVTDANHIVIDPWPYPDVTPGVSYKIVQRSPLRIAGAQAMADVDRLVAILNGMGTIYPVEGDAPDPSIGEEGQLALKTNTGVWQQWRKTGGVWVLQGIPVGTNYRGAWDTAANYAGNDVVARAGSSYIARSPNSGQPPESSLLVWDVLAQKGDQGNKGDKGDAGTPATVAINSVATLPPGAAATVTNLGTVSAASIRFGIPQGVQGIPGVQGNQGVGLEPDDTGTLAQRAAHDGEAKGFKYLVIEVSPFQLWIKASNTSGDWAGPDYIGGNFPVGDMGHATDSIVQSFDFGHAI